MLPKVELREVTRADVDRVARWLEDPEVSARWFGHYACGDPIHRGYDPDHMLEASDTEWRRVFRSNTHRAIFSIYGDHGEHVGECQMLSDDRGGTELSLLIGRRDLWHRGYGTSTVVTLLDQAFTTMDKDRAWVNVPEDNAPALGLFSKLGFAHEATRELCRRPDGSSLNACILSMAAREFEARELRETGRGIMPAVTIAGLPGSGADAVGAEIARATGGRLMDEEITKKMCQLLGRTLGEVQVVESSVRSAWSRSIKALLAPWERFGLYEASYDWVGSWPTSGYFEPHEYLTKGEYLDGLRRTIRELASEPKAVLHGHGSHLFFPPNVASLHVFVGASDDARRERIAAREGLSLRNAARWLKRADRATLAVYRHLFGAELLDMGRYDLTLNLDRLSVESAARTVAGALEGRSREKAAAELVP